MRQDEPRSRRFGLEEVSTVVQTRAILGAGAWGVYTFVYEAKIAPGPAPPSVSVTSALDRVGQRGDMVAIRSTVTRTNVGQARVRVLGLTYNVLGVRVRFGAGTGGAAAPATVTAARGYAATEPGEVLLRHGVLFAGATDAEPSALNPGEAVSRDLIFYVDAARFDSVRFLVALAYAKASDPPVPLVSEVGPEGRIAALPGSACQAAPGRCDALVVTDFGTEFSLWRP